MVDNGDKGYFETKERNLFFFFFFLNLVLGLKIEVGPKGPWGVGGVGAG